MRKYTFLLLIIFLLSINFLIAEEEKIELKEINWKIHIDKTVINLMTSSLYPLPHIYSLKENPLIVVMELKGIKLGNIKNEYEISSPLVNKIKIVDLNKGDFQVHFALNKISPYRVFFDKEILSIEFFDVERVLDPELEELYQKSELERANPSILEDIKVKKDKDTLEVTMFFSSEMSYQNFTLENPKRIVFDFLNSKSNMKTQVINVGLNGVEKIRISQFIKDNPDVTRIVFDIGGQDFPIYEIERKEKILKIYFKQKIQEQSEKNEKEMELKRSDVERINPEDPEKDGENKLSDSNEKSQKENQAKEEAEEKKYKGEKISFRLKDADIRDVLRFIATQANLNIIIDPEVAGKVTCELIEIPWDQALEFILRTNGLGMILEENILRIARVDVLAREEQDKQRLRDAKLLAGELKIVTKTLSYAKAESIKSILEKQLSSRGEIIVDSRTNTLIISDIEDRISAIDKLIQTLDKATPQVSIEARIIETNVNYIQSLGIQWGFNVIADSSYGNQTTLKFPSSIYVNGTGISGTQAGGIQGVLGGYAINLPAPAFTTGIGVSLGNVLDTFRLDMALTAMETYGKGKILSAPKITAQNNERAEIMQGRQIPVQTVANNTVTTRYVNAALELHVTPQITAEGTIIMDIEINNNAADFANLVQGIPPIITQSARTTVLVKDGGTAVIGGIYRVEDTEAYNRVPGISKVPILGYLFRGTMKTRADRELLIFITPRIVRGG
ncbi:MAG: type IV pilus secretin PilQ [Acidobacteriota bacterium]